MLGIPKIPTFQCKVSIESLETFYLGLYYWFAHLNADCRYQMMKCGVC